MFTVAISAFVTSQLTIMRYVQKIKTSGMQPFFQQYMFSYCKVQ